MNKAYAFFCRAYQTVFRAALPILPYREPVQLDGLASIVPLLAEKKISFDIRPASLTILGINKWGERAIFALNDTSYQWKKGPIGIFKYPFGE